MSHNHSVFKEKVKNILTLSSILLSENIWYPNQLPLIYTTTKTDKAHSRLDVAKTRLW